MHDAVKKEYEPAQRDDVIRIVVPVDIALYGKNAIKSGNVRRAKNSAGKMVVVGQGVDQTKKGRQAARNSWLAAKQPRATSYPVRVDVHVVRGTGRLMDEFNIAFAAASLIDGIFVDGVTPDDHPKYVQLGRITQESKKSLKGREHVVFTATPVTKPGSNLFTQS